jgi:hypothetical protein
VLPTGRPLWTSTANPTPLPRSKQLLHLGIPILIDGEPVFVEAAYRRNALDDLEPAT